jgi:aspartyl protease family protein
MLLNRITVLTVATLSALLAGEGVIAVARARTETAPVIPRSADGHYWAEAMTSSDVGRARIRFLVDTGASSVALSADDARRLGLQPEKLIYSRPVFTAQGQVQAAPVMLSRIDVGGAAVREVRALVLKDGPSTSLLGMSFLGRLSRIEATPEALILRR